MMPFNRGLEGLDRQERRAVRQAVRKGSRLLDERLREAAVAHCRYQLEHSFQVALAQTGLLVVGLLVGLAVLVAVGRPFRVAFFVAFAVAAVVVHLTLLRSGDRRRAARCLEVNDIPRGRAEASDNEAR